MASGDAGFAHADPLYAERLNKLWILGRLTHPVFDHDVDKAVSATVVAIQGDDVLSSGETTHYTAGDLAIVHRLTLTNNHSARNQVSLHIIESGGSRGVSNCIFDDNLYPGETMVLDGPWFLDTGDTIRSISAAATANQVGLRGEAIELSTALDFVGLNVTDGVTLTTSLASIYTCPGSNVADSLVVALTICNTDTAKRLVTVEIRPSGGSQADRQNILARTFFAGESYIIGGFTLKPGDVVYAKASANSVVSMRPTVVEFSSQTS